MTPNRIPQKKGERTLYYEEKNASESIFRVSDTLTSYLDTLSKKVPASTCSSHKQDLKTFEHWYPFKEIAMSDIILVAANFVEHIWKDTTSRYNETAGYIYSISNYFGYVCREDPELISIRLLHKMRKNIGKEVSTLINKVSCALTGDKGPSGASKQRICQSVSYLGKSCFGSRTHAFVKVILNTNARPCSVQKLNYSDFRADEGTLNLQISNQFLLGKYDVISTRRSEVSDNAKQVLLEYIKHNRISVSGDSRPLFTTPHGRASPSTLRRSLQHASNNCVQSQYVGPEGERKLSNDSLTPVQPSDIWWYAINQPD